MGEADKALAYAEKSYQLDPTKPRRLFDYGQSLWKAGNAEKAEEFLDKALRLAEARLEAGDKRQEPPCVIAEVHAMKGDTSDACRWLQACFEAGPPAFWPMMRDPSYEEFRNEECFQRIITEVKAERERMRLLIEEMEKEWEK
jgi:tetratricopeptide (TPR) repeat protein